MRNLPVAYYLFPTWECFVPRLGIFHSQCGNIKPDPTTPRIKLFCFAVIG